MSGPGSDERHLELKVGAMILVALALLIAFVLILSDWTLKSRKEISVLFQNPGGLSPGAAVKVAGREVGKITEMTFLGVDGPANPITRKPSLVRARIAVNSDIFASLRSDARFYVTTKGVLGDPFLEVDPGSAAGPLDTSKPLFGVDPPRLDLFLADAFELVRGLNSLLERNAGNLDVILGGGARLVGAVDKIAAEDAGVVETARFDRILDGVEGLLNETRALVTGAKERYVDDPKVARTLANMESLSGKLDRDIDPLVADVRKALETVDRLGAAIGPEEQQRIKSAIAKLDDIATRADKMVGGVNELVDRIRRGEGTVGQLMQDEEIYDDLKELIRDIKKHPWKIIWEE